MPFYLVLIIFGQKSKISFDGHIIAFFQIVECFPNSMPKELPEVIQKIKWTKPGREVENWDMW